MGLTGEVNKLQLHESNVRRSSVLTDHRGAICSVVVLAEVGTANGSERVTWSPGCSEAGLFRSTFIAVRISDSPMVTANGNVVQCWKHLWRISRTADIHFNAKKQWNLIHKSRRKEKVDIVWRAMKGSRISRRGASESMGKAAPQPA